MIDSIKSKGINVLVHFTRLENLDNILKNGLIPKNILVSDDSDFIFNDNYRYDGHEDASCCSITFPNYKMFFSLRSDGEDTEWVVIGISPNVLIEKDVAFTPTNAASIEVSSSNIDDFKGLDAFEDLFKDYEHISRKSLNIPTNYTTNPQAEVLVFDTIEPKYIVGVVAQTKVRQLDLLKKYPNHKIIVNSKYFKGRSDYEFWR